MNFQKVVEALGADRFDEVKRILDSRIPAECPLKRKSVIPADFRVCGKGKGVDFCCSQGDIGEDLCFHGCLGTWHID